jgi:hypothetical protein
VQQPADVGDPYTLLPDGLPQPGTSGVALAWDGMRWFWGTVAQQAWFDMQAVQQIGGVWV